VRREIERRWTCLNAARARSKPSRIASPLGVAAPVLDLARSAEGSGGSSGNAPGMILSCEGSRRKEERDRARE